MVLDMLSTSQESSECYSMNGLKWPQNSSQKNVFSDISPCCFSDIILGKFSAALGEFLHTWLLLS